MTKDGHSAIVATRGNEDCHIILRGGKTPNYDDKNVELVRQAAAKAGVSTSIMIDVSHANSAKDEARQIPVCQDIAKQVELGTKHIIGVMVESHIVGGRQELKPGVSLVYGQSITDGCINWEQTTALLEGLAAAVRARRTT